MTVQQAHSRLQAILADLRPNLPSAEVLALQNRLLALANELPMTEEFDPMAEAIRGVAQALLGQLTQSVLTEVKSRTAALDAAVAALNRIEHEAATDARTLSFQKPMVIAAGLKNGLALAQQLRDAVKQGNTAATSEKAEALLAVLAMLKGTIKLG